MPRFSLKAEVEYMLESHVIIEEKEIKDLIEVLDAESNKTDVDTDIDLKEIDLSDIDLEDIDPRDIELEDSSSDSFSNDDNGEESDGGVIDDKEEDNFYRDVSDILKSKLATGVPARIELNKVQGRRYLKKRVQNRVKLVTPERRLEVLEQLDDDDFKEEIRMSKSSFYKLIDMIKDHHLYQPKDGKPQRDIRLQVAIVLERLGTNGNGGSHSRLARRCGVGRKFFFFF